MDILKEHPPEWHVSWGMYANGERYYEITDNNDERILEFSYTPASKELAELICKLVNAQHANIQEFEEWHRREHPEHYEEDTGDLLIKDDEYAARKEGWLASNSGRKKLAEELKEGIDTSSSSLETIFEDIYHIVEAELKAE